MCLTIDFQVYPMFFILLSTVDGLCTELSLAKRYELDSNLLNEWGEINTGSVVSVLDKIPMAEMAVSTRRQRERKQQEEEEERERPKKKQKAGQQEEEQKEEDKNDDDKKDEEKKGGGDEEEKKMPAKEEYAGPTEIIKCPCYLISRGERGTTICGEKLHGSFPIETPGVPFKVDSNGRKKVDFDQSWATAKAGSATSFIKKYRVHLIERQVDHGIYLMPKALWTQQVLNLEEACDMWNRTTKGMLKLEVTMKHFKFLRAMRGVKVKELLNVSEDHEANPDAAKRLYEHIRQYNYNRKQHSDLLLCAINLLTIGQCTYPNYIVDWDKKEHISVLNKEQIE